MKLKIEEWKRGKAQAQFREEMEHIKLETICQELVQLREKNLADEDGIRDYFKFYRRTDLGIEEFFEITGTVKSRPTLGRIKYSEKTTPFEKTNFNKYLDTRNSIEHRGKVEATLRETYVARSFVLGWCWGGQTVFFSVSWVSRSLALLKVPSPLGCGHRLHAETPYILSW
jgi:hypothetical protein